MRRRRGQCARFEDKNIFDSRRLLENIGICKDYIENGNFYHVTLINSCVITHIKYIECIIPIASNPRSLSKLLIFANILSAKVVTKPFLLY